MRILRFFFVFGILALGLFFFSRSSFWSLEEIEVEGNSILTREEVVGLSGLVPGQNLFAINKNEVRQRLLLHPMIRTANVRLYPPATVVCKIEERQALAAIPAPGTFWELDGDSVLLGTKSALSNSQLLLLTGVPVPSRQPLPGEKVSGPELDCLMTVVRALSPQLREAIQEVHFGPEGVYFYTRKGVKVYLGQVDNLEAKLVLFWAIYQEQTQQDKPLRLAYIDVSYPKAPVLRYLDEGE